MGVAAGARESVIERTRMWLLEQSWFSSTVLPVMPRRLRWGLRTIYLAPIDLTDRIRGRRDPSAPPKYHTFTGGVHGFARTGDHLVNALIEVAGLTPSSAVLDVGCGVGRLALPLSRFLDADGSYEGLDIVADGIDWCRTNISPGPYGNVNFTLADIYNREYNPGGQLRASEYILPYSSRSFDVVVLISVFTHMLPADLERYISEIERVLKPGGRCFATFFLMTPDSQDLMETSGRAIFRFRRVQTPCWVLSAKVPELGVAYDDGFIMKLLADYGLTGKVDSFPGRWCGRDGHWPPDSGLGDQDTLVLTKD